MLRQGYLTRANFVANKATRSCLPRRGEPQMTYATFPVGLPLFPALSEDLVLAVHDLAVRQYNWESECIAIVYSFARIFRAMSCNAMRIKLLRRRAGLTITPWFQCRELILVFVFFTPVVGFPPQMTLVFISGTRRPYLERKRCIEPRLYERTGLNKGNQSSA
jgi:hypothetical protein